MTSVVVIDDQQLLRRGLRLVLETVSEVTVVGEAADGLEGLAVVGQVHPDVVLCDARMPVMDGIEFVVACGERFPDLPVIVLTTFDDEDLVRAALAVGAAGFLLKDISPEALADAIHAVAADGLVIDPRVARAVIRPPRGGRGEKARTGAAPPGRDADALPALTRAERAVARHVATGATNAEIAAELVLAEGTVKNHVSAIMRKLGSRDRTALALALHEAFHAPT